MTEGPGWAAPDPQPEQPPAYYQPPPAMPPPPPGWGAPKPGVIPLRPLGVGDILDGAISTMRAHPRVILGVSAIVAVVGELIIAFSTFPLLGDISSLGPRPTEDEALSLLGKLLVVFGIILVVTVLLRVFLSGFLTIAIGKAVLGQPVSFGATWQRVRPRLPALFGLTLIYPSIAIASFVLAFVVTAIIGLIGLLLIIAVAVFLVWLYIALSLATPALMLENARVGRALGRSRQLVRGSWWRMLGIQLLAFIIAAIVAQIVQAPFSLFGGGFGQIFSTEPVAPTVTTVVLTTIGGIIASTLTDPFVAGVTVLLYTDQRMRREGMDIELARAAGITPPHPL
jgi:hypothetical protein